MIAAKISANPHTDGTVSANEISNATRYFGKCFTALWLLVDSPVVGHFDGFIKRGFGGLVILGFFDAAIVDQLLARINGFG